MRWLTNTVLRYYVRTMEQEGRPLPGHIAIIIDGNRRWARAHGLRPQEGHAKGAKVLEKINEAAVNLGIKYLTIWGGSYDNLTKRDPQEIKMLDEKMYRVWARNGLKNETIFREGVHIRFIGEWPDLLSQETQDAMRALEKATQDHSVYHYTYLIGYSGDREMTAGFNSILRSGVGGISLDVIQDHLWTKDLPAVDLVIRTGEENPNMSHNSNGFMMWHTRNAFFYHISKFWPDFTVEDLKDIIKQFRQTERRFGK
ncbi:MAG: polyprenyl diphosphate synthase [Candidatus Colwellbacteria bacterium]|nr:polyprenyl diphosphate synthase [Candidatus Colwellbacteria bacterium]